ncbi:MAG: serine protease, partial [Planctomycetota bacterium]
SPQSPLISYCVDVSEIRSFVASTWKPAPQPTKKLLDNAGIEHSKHATGHYEVKQALSSGVTQDVFVAKETEYFQRADVRKIWSLVSVSKQEPDAKLMMRLLRQSAATKIGSWAVEKNESGEHMVLYVAKLDATAPDQALKATIDYVARIANAMSKQLAPEKAQRNAAETLAGWLAK